MRYYGVQNEVKAYCNRLQSETSITVTPSLVKTLNDRVESLKKSGIWSQYGLGFNDRDADSYFQRASVNDVLGRAEVCWFVRGIKALGLWQNMVSWPLRSYQNAGTGSTAFSLGGLGTFNGTLVNSPTWDTIGVTSLVASAQGISATVGNLSLSEQTLFGISRVFNSNNGSVIIARNSTGGTQNGMNLRNSEFLTDISSIQQAGGTTTISVNYANSTNFFAYAAAANSINAIIKRFPSAQSAVTNLNFSGNLTNTDPLWIGRRNAAAGTSNNTVSFAAMFTRDARSIWDLLYTLYKQTLGSNLSLP
jgi:uncharacterized protein YfiM (DUF2279 family)